MYRCPITYFANNIIFNADGSVWAAYRMAGYDYDFLDDELKISMLYRMAKFLCGIMSEAQIIIVPVEQDTESSSGILSAVWMKRTYCIARQNIMRSRP